jgi:hypothetical protein
MVNLLKYYNAYKESPERALNELRSRLSDEMKGLMIHIESEKDYEAIDELRSIINGKFSDDIRKPKILRDRELIKKLNILKNSNEGLYNSICSLTLEVKDKAKEMKTDYRLLDKKKHPLGWLIVGMLGIIATFPLFIYGNIFNLTFLEIPNLQIRKIRDPQFHSSIRYALSLIMAFVLLPLALILLLVFVSPWWLALLVFFTLPLSGLFAWNYYLQFRRIIGGFRIRNMIKLKNIEFETLAKNYNELVRLVSEL